MPTGYTAGILSGETKSFKQFAIDCMRAFGATIHMRDEPMDKPYEPRTPSEYYSKRIGELKKQISDLTSTRDFDLIGIERGELEVDKAYHEAEIEKIRENRERL